MPFQQVLIIRAAKIKPTTNVCMNLCVPLQLNVSFVAKAIIKIFELCVYL